MIQKTLIKIQDIKIPQKCIFACFSSNWVINQAKGNNFFNPFYKFHSLLPTDIQNSSIITVQITNIGDSTYFFFSNQRKLLVILLYLVIQTLKNMLQSQMFESINLYTNYYYSQFQILCFKKISRKRLQNLPGKQEGGQLQKCSSLNQQHFPHQFSTKDADQDIKIPDDTASEMHLLVLEFQIG